MTQASSRLPGLDGLRACAVLCVIFSHAGVSTGWPDWEVLDQLRRVFSGLFGVQVFFTISGFIITLLLLKERTRSGSICLRDFWLRRALRILPPAGAYLIFLNLMHASGQAEVPAETQWGSLLFYRNMMPYEPWFTEAQGFTGHFWTLSVEEQFYLVWPVLVMLLPPTLLRRVAWVGIVASMVLRLPAPWLPPGSLRWLPMCLDGFMMGALVAFAVHADTSAFWHGLWRHRWWLLGGALLVTRMASSAHAVWFEPVQPLAAALASAVWIAGLARGGAGVESRVLNSRPLVALGLISYSVYLWQQIWLAPPFQWASGTAPWLGMFPQNIVFCLVCGAASYWLIEKPCQWLRARLLQKTAPVAQPLPT